jgi:hypothetical protein
MPAEPNAVFKANQIDRAQLPKGVKLFFPIDKTTLTRLSKVELKSNGRVQLSYYTHGKRRQLTIDGEDYLVVSYQDLDGHLSSAVMRQARHASSPFSGVMAPMYDFNTREPLANSVLAAMYGSNHYG